MTSRMASPRSSARPASAFVPRHPSTSLCPACEAEPGAVPDFDPLARPYRWLELFTFGPLLQKTRTHFLDQLGSRRHALVLGDGDGRFTAALLARWPRMQVHAVDGSPAMLRALSRRCRPFAARLTTGLADLRTWSPHPAATYDLITTHFFLDCLSTEEAAGLARRIRPSAIGDALWVVSDFAIPKSHYGRWIAAPLVSGLYLAFRLLTALRTRKLPDHAAALQAEGWTLRRQHNRLRGLLISQVWQQDENLH